MEFQCSIVNALFLIIPTIIYLIYIYYRNKKYKVNKKWRKEFFHEFDFDHQSKEIDVSCLEGIKF